MNALQKRKRLMKFLIGVFIGVILVWITLVAIDFADDRTVELFTISGLLGSAGLSWIPVQNLKEVKKELDRRRENEPSNKS